jgi:monoamine oxidase
MINLWSQVMHGVESTEQPAAWFIDYFRRSGSLFFIRAMTRLEATTCDSTRASSLVFETSTTALTCQFAVGSQSIANGIAQLVRGGNIHLSSPVTLVRNRSTHVEIVTTHGKTFAARKYIMSIPTTMYKELNFEPRLPAPIQELANSNILGDYNKAIICCDRPWWRDSGLNGYFLSNTGPIKLARDTSVDEKRHYSLTCFVNGQFGRDWAKLPPQERRAVVLKQVAHIFNAGEDSEVF